MEKDKRTSRIYNYQNINNLQSKPEPDFIMKGLEAGMVGFIVGNGGAGKGWFINHMLFASINKTTNFLFEGLDKAPKIAYFSFEDNYAQWSRRAYDCNLYYNDQTELNKANDTFTFHDYSETGGMFKDLETLEVIEDMKKDIKDNNSKLVIIDTLSVINQRYNENDNREMAILLEELKQFARETNTAVLIVHHTNKTAINANTETNEASMRGASALIGNARFVLTLEKSKIEDPSNKKNKIYCKNWVEVRMDKVNFIKPESRIYYRNSLGVLIEQSQATQVVDDKDITDSSNKIII